MKNYKQKKEDARTKAIDWQLKASEERTSYYDLANVGNYFYKLGKRYGLLREFRTNAIPC